MTRLTDERLAELYAGTLRLVVEHGFDRLTMDQVAEATRSSKATLYRQWGSKATLVADALMHSVRDHHTVDIDTGDLRTDLLAMLTRGKPDGIEDGALIGALMHAGRTDPELGDAMRAQVIAFGRERIDEVLARAVQRGEVAPSSPGLAQVPLLIMALIVLQPVIDGTEWGDDEKQLYVDHVLAPVLGITP